MADEEQLAVVRQLAHVWNHWRTDNPEVSHPDLSGADLSGVGLFEMDFSLRILE